MWVVGEGAHMHETIGGGWLYIFLCIRMYIYMYMYVYMYIYVYIYDIYICMYTCKGVEEVWCVAPVVQQWLLVLAYE